ncbi:hypothetical protein V6N12_044406 [Hibiscus sabdariffa]
MKITLDLENPILSKIIINGRVQLVEYEALLTVCFECGIYGHIHGNCLSLKPDNISDVSVVPDTTFDQDHPPLIPSAPPDMGQTNRQPNSTPYAQQPLYPPGTIVTFRRPSEIGLISFKRNLTLLMVD